MRNYINVYYSVSMGKNAGERHFSRMSHKYFRGIKKLTFRGLFSSEDKADTSMSGRHFTPQLTTFFPCVLTTTEANAAGISDLPIKAKYYAAPVGKNPAIAAFKIK